MPSIPDPFSQTFATNSASWGPALNAATRDCYIFLFMVELAILGVQSLYFKDSVFEYFKMFAGKVIIGSFLMIVLANANIIFPAIINEFTSIGGSVAGGLPPPVALACEGKQRWTCPPPQAAHTDTLEGELMGLGVLYFTAGDVSRVVDSVLAVALGFLVGTPFPPDPGNGDAGIPMDFLMGHGQFQLVCFALGMACMASAAGVFFTYVLLSFEVQIVLVLGVIVLAGHGTRFTKVYADAFPQYVFTIGTKFFTYYFVVAIMNQVMGTVYSNLAGLIGGLIAAAAIPFGAGAIVILLATSAAPVACMLCAIMIYSVPQIAASFTKGGSALNAGSSMGRVMGFAKGQM